MPLTAATGGQRCLALVLPAPKVQQRREDGAGAGPGRRSAGCPRTEGPHAVHTHPAAPHTRGQKGVPVSLCATRSGSCRPGADVTCALARQTQPLVCFVEPPTQPLKLKKEKKKKAAAVDFIIGLTLNKLHTIIS